MEQLSLGMLTCDAHEASAPYESDRWASTDRGWLYDPAHPNADYHGGNLPIGNYLDYGPCGEHYRNNPDGAVHVCFTPWWIDPVTRSICRGVTESTHVHTPAEAQAWLAEQYRLWTARRAADKVTP
jgi:hypothetical protein